MTLALELDVRRFVWELEVDCLQCGRSITTLLLDCPTQLALLPRGVRCRHCGGDPVSSGELHAVSLPEPRADGFEPALRGRPRKVWVG